jgi:hypothetical protein
MKRRTIIFAVAAVALTSLLAVTALAATTKTIRGTPGPDNLVGTAAADNLIGLGGRDKLKGLGGNDKLTGGGGADTMDCGAGKADVAVFDLQDKSVKNCELLKGPKPVAAIADVAATPEGNSGATTFSFAVVLSHRMPAPVTVSYATSDGSATAGSDYQAVSGKISFAAGKTAAAVSVPVSGDSIVEPDETFTVTLSAPENATLGKATATGTIQNDDVVKARPGPHNGTNSQGKALSFDVSPDASSVANLNTIIDLNCTEVQGFTVTVPLESQGIAQINPDLTFDANNHNVGSDGSTLDINFHGQLTASSGASGTLRVDLTIPGVPGICSTGDVTWTTD